MPRGTCRFCQCTDAQACEGGCSWADEAETLCTRCELAFNFAQKTLPVMAALARKAPRTAVVWSELPLEHQTALVMAFRLLSDGVRDHMFAACGEDLTNAAVDLATLASVLYEKFPAEMEQADAAGDPPVAVAIELLEKLVSPRVQLT
jgi:hypothetical protein